MSRYSWLLLLLLAIAFLLRVDFIFYILYIALGIFVWSRWRTPRALRRLSAAREYRRRAFLGEPVEIKLTLTNYSRLTIPWLQITEYIPPELRVEESVQLVRPIRGRRTISHTYHVRGQQRGYYSLGPLRLMNGDLFGLAKPNFGYLAPDYLTVYPQIISLAELGLPSRLPFGTIAGHQRLFEDPARAMGVRAFRSGDSLRQINWKASAHTGQHLVRTLEPAISLETAILLDLHSGSYERRSRHEATEWAIVVAASLAAWLINQRQAVGLSSSGVDPLRLQADERVFDEVTGRLLFEAAEGNLNRYMAPAIASRNGRPHLMKILEQLARLDTRETIPFPEWAPGACMNLSWGITILAITARGDEATINMLHHLVRQGFNPILIAIEPTANFGRVREQARRLGFRAWNISSRHDLTQWQRPRTAPSTRAALR